MKQHALSRMSPLASVSRETLDKLKAYAALLQKWSQRKNLLSHRDISEIWDRHIMDCLHIPRLIAKEEGTKIDLGSGNGLPGIVMAICGVSNLYLVERNHSKAAFLRYALAELDATAQVIAQDCREITMTGAIITARAFAPLATLLDWSTLLRDTNTKYFLHKGKNYQQEIDAAAIKYSFSLKKYVSSTADEGVILAISRIKEIKR